MIEEGWYCQVEWCRYWSCNVAVTSRR